MRRRSISLAAAFVLLVAAAIRFSPPWRQWLASPAGSPAPAPGAGPASVDGPYFSDGGRVADRIVGAINRTRVTLEVAIYDLTHSEIASALEAAHRRGVKVRIVADERQSREPHSEIPYLVSRGLAIRLSRGYRGNRSIMHDKFAVFDGKLAETGSFNWTTSADGFNYENAIFMENQAVVARFQAEFERIWAQAR